MDGEPVTLPEDIADQFFLYTLAEGHAGDREAALNMSVPDAILWRHLMRYSAHLEEEHMRKKMKE